MGKLKIRFKEVDGMELGRSGYVGRATCEVIDENGKVLANETALGHAKLIVIKDCMHAEAVETICKLAEEEATLNAKRKALAAAMERIGENEKNGIDNPEH